MYLLRLNTLFTLSNKLALIYIHKYKMYSVDHSHVYKQLKNRQHKPKLNRRPSSNTPRPTQHNAPHDEIPDRAIKEIIYLKKCVDNQQKIITEITTQKEDIEHLYDQFVGELKKAATLPKPSPPAAGLSRSSVPANSVDSLPSPPDIKSPRTVSKATQHVQQQIKQAAKNKNSLKKKKTDVFNRLYSLKK